MPRRAKSKQDSKQRINPENTSRENAPTRRRKSASPAGKHQSCNQWLVSLLLKCSENRQEDNVAANERQPGRPNEKVERGGTAS